jgi:hypothetical protein
MENVNYSRSNKGFNILIGCKHKDQGSHKLIRTVYILNDLFNKNDHKKYQVSTEILCKLKSKLINKVIFDGVRARVKYTCFIGIIFNQKIPFRF